MYERDFDSLEADPAEEGKRHWMALIDWLRVKAFPELTVARYVAGAMATKGPCKIS